MDVFGLCDIYSCAIGDTIYIRKVTQIFAGVHPFTLSVIGERLCVALRVSASASDSESFP